MRVVLKNVGEIEADLDFPKRVLLDPQMLIDTLKKSVAAHTNNANNAKGKSDYLKGYHDGAAERLGFILQDIELAINNAPKEGVALVVSVVDRL